jgi:hypothetical protein
LTQPTPRASRRLGLAALLAVVSIALAACGSSGGGTSTGTTAASPRAAFKCLSDAGLKPQSTTPGKGVISALHVESKPSPVNVLFAQSKARATSLAGAINKLTAKAGKGAGAKVVGGSVILATGPGSSNDLDTIEGCVTG